MTEGSLKIVPRGEREIVMTRVFDALRQLVFDTYTKPELVQRWLLGPDGWSMPVCEMDVRAGGAYRWVWRRDQDGTEMGVRGVYREVSPPSRLVNTELFDDPWYPGESLITSEFTEQGGKTLLTVTMMYASREARDGVLKSGMERGVAMSYDRLEKIVTAAR